MSVAPVVPQESRMLALSWVLSEFYNRRDMRATYLLLCSLLMIYHPLPALAQQNSAHDFDWDIGTWKTHQKRLLHPLTGSTTWVEYNGTDVIQKIWDGANTGKIEADGPAGNLEIYTVRLYNPESHQWSIYFANSGSGSLGVPVVGGFSNGRGEFYDQEPYNGREIFVRFRVYDITTNSCRFDQAFSADGGKTWETNFIVTEQRGSTNTSFRADRATLRVNRPRRA